jgi:hypothetical protein
MIGGKEGKISMEPSHEEERPAAIKNGAIFLVRLFAHPNQEAVDRSCSILGSQKLAHKRSERGIVSQQNSIGIALIAFCKYLVINGTKCNK